MKKIVTFLVLIFVISVYPQKNVDGSSADWTGTKSGTVHATVVSDGEAIYTGADGDVRPDQHGGGVGGEYDSDLNEVRFTRDDNYLYLLFKFRDLTDLNRPYITILVDSDQSDDSPLWMGDNSPVSLASGTNRGWERQIAIHATTSGNLNIELYADNGSNWYAPPSVTYPYSVSGSTLNDVVEAKIALSDVNLTTTSNVRFAIATFRNGVGWSNDGDVTTASYIDIVSPGYSGTAESWVRAGSSETINSNINWSQDLTPLPVELTSFSASVKNKSVNLVWHTATEINNYGFEIEKRQSSIANIQWSKVGFVNGNGNSNSANEYSFIDKTVTSGKYTYRLKQIDNDGKYEYSKEVEVDLGKPTTFALNQNYPNPFNPSTSIQYSVVGSQYVSLKVFNVLGKEVAVLVNEKQEPGTYTVDFTSANLSGGAYFYRLQAGEFMQTKKMILLK